MRRAPLPGVLVFVVLLVAACTGGAEEPEATITIPVETTTTQPTTTTTAVPVAADASCVACHTDKATLQALAMEPVAGEVHSEGEG